METNAQLFEAYLKCPTKCWLRSRGETGGGSPYADWVEEQNENYRVAGVRRLQETVPEGECIVAPPIGEIPKGGRWRLAFDVQMPVSAGSDCVPRPEKTLDEAPGQTAVGITEAQTQPGPCLLESRLHSVERVTLQGRGRSAQFIPIRFIFRNKLTRDDRLLVAFDVLVMSEFLGHGVSQGKIIHGDACGTLKVKTEGLLGQVRKLTAKMVQVVAGGSPPDLVLNRHCGECEFLARCRQKAIEKDDLSLLAGMSEKEIKKLHSKGIFTITQLSYTFRPRRRRKRLRDKREKYHHSLKALAIREKKIHIVGSPELKIEGTPVYLDVEGLPDRDFYYLIGVRVGNGTSAVQHSLWADTVEDEGNIWRQFLDIIEAVSKPVLIHYGSYETIFFKRMCERFGAAPEGSVAAKGIQAGLNLLSVTFAQVYFPAFSNGLKEIAGHLGFRWSDVTASGMRTVAWRHEWEASRTAASKRALVIYNTEDCAALEVVANKLLELHQGPPQAGSCANGEIVDTAKLKWEHPYGFKRNTFAFPELNTINNAAYWDYQRERVYVKSNVNLKCVLTRPERSKRVLPANKTIECPRPRNCPKCASEKFVKHAKYTKTVFNLKFMRHGIKRWITRYRFHRYLCQSCRTVFQPVETRWGKGKYGSEIIAYALYLSIELRLPQMHVDHSLNKLFGFDVAIGTTSCRFKEQAAKTYGLAYEALLKRLCAGRLLHADETRVNWGSNSGFVWVFANMQEVAYVYSCTREGDMLQTMLKDFKGVLVSDFYAAYDAIDCPQQKCLIHLIRDLNDDVLKHPYDEDLKRLVLAFALLLKPMVETIDHYGLKSHFLRKHLPIVNRFYRELSKADIKSELAAKLKERFMKNRGKLFTFLNFDGVPWNNNNAEHAVKPFAKLRQVFGGTSTEKGIREYLVLLSLCETCKYMGLDFLDFLRSGEKDIQVFAERRGGRRRRPQATPLSVLPVEPPPDNSGQF
jgi:predicted RecB family nuclease